MCALSATAELLVVKLCLYYYYCCIENIAIDGFLCSFVLVGLSLNNTIKNLDLNLSMSALGAGGSQVLEVLIANIRCIGSLDISDNGQSSQILQHVVFIARH